MFELRGSDISKLINFWNVELIMSILVILDEEPQNKLYRNWYINYLSNIIKRYILYIDDCFIVIY